MTDNQFISDILTDGSHSMTEDLLLFFRNEKADDKGRMFDDILKFDNFQLECCHDFIQWIFPTRNDSSFNPNAPLITSEFIERFQKDEIAQRNYCKSCKLYLNYLGFDCPGCKGHAYRLEKSSTRFYNLPQHNHQRISRVMNSMKETGHEECTTQLYKLLYQDLLHNSIVNVSVQTLQIWESIARRPR